MPDLQSTITTNCYKEHFSAAVDLKESLKLQHVCCDCWIYTLSIWPAECCMADFPVAAFIFCRSDFIHMNNRESISFIVWLHKTIFLRCSYCNRWTDDYRDLKMISMRLFVCVKGAIPVWSLASSPFWRISMADYMYVSRTWTKHVLIWRSGIWRHGTEDLLVLNDSTAVFILNEGNLMLISLQLYCYNYWWYEMCYITIMVH